MFLYGDGVVGTAFEGEVIGKYHALPALHISNASNDVPRGHALIEARELAKSQPWGTSIQNFTNARSGIKLLAFCELCLLFSRELHRLVDVVSQLHVQHVHLLDVVLVLLRSCVVVFTKDLHEVLVLMRIPSLVDLTLEIIVKLLFTKTAAVSCFQSNVSDHVGGRCCAHTKHWAETRCIALQTFNKCFAQTKHLCFCSLSI